jgi:hypothetical protein
MHYSILRRIRHEAVRGCKEAMMRATTVSKFSHTVIGMRTVGRSSLQCVLDHDVGRRALEVSSFSYGIATDW